ncbi:Na(+)/H(+) antiporter NhaD [Galdieria sulphuraria]|nr:Na(+)/H(+) antiporter NhaD [Galdieria sulphuraria]
MFIQCCQQARYFRTSVCNRTFVNIFRKPKKLSLARVSLIQICCKKVGNYSDDKEVEDSNISILQENQHSEQWRKPVKNEGEKVSTEDQTKQDVPRTLALLFLLTTGAFLLQHSWLAEHQSLALSITFFVAYCGIIFEEILLLNKTAISLLAAVILWSTYSTTKEGYELDAIQNSLSSHLSSIAEVIFFLIGAMTIVEVVDAHRGFQLVTDWIKTSKKSVLLWITGTISFILSSVLDNLTSTIVMVSLLRKANLSDEERRLFGAAIVVAANAGGAWTPIGDVTTTMLWIQGHISTFGVMDSLFIPSLTALLISLAIYTRQIEDKEKVHFIQPEHSSSPVDHKRGRLVLGTGMLAGLGTMWLLTDVLHVGQSTEDSNLSVTREHLKTTSALNRIDVASILFFLGILLCVACLDSAGILKDWAGYISEKVPSLELVAFIIGLASSIIDNVPIVAACMGMYDSVTFPQDSTLWQLIAFCAGTGGSIFIIGSAAGVALMGLEKVDFFWYLKKATLGAFAGYSAGVAAYLILHSQQWISFPRQG